MVSQSFHVVKSISAGRRIQLPPCTRPKVVLSKEARAALKHSRQEKSRQFRDTLDDAWNQLDEATKTIAVSHHKSVRRVQNDLYIGRGLLRSRHSKLNTWNAFCWKKNQETENRNQGRGALESLVHENRDEYLRLSKDEQDNILAEYADWKTTKVTGLRVSTKSKINDITQTLKAVENELNSLNCRTGAETILYMTRGSTDLPLRGVAFATEGVQHFMNSVMGIDNQDLVSKMEGFAVQGMKGAATNHKQQVSEIRSKIRDIINTKLQLVTGDPDARMQWTHYFRNVVQRYQVAIEGWPDNIPFANLSQVSSARPDLEMLYSKWESKQIKWKVLTDEEFEELYSKRQGQIDRGEIVDHRRRTRSDKGKKRKGLAAATNPNRRKKYKSSETIEDNDCTDEEREHGDEERDEPVDEPVRRFSTPAAARAANQPSTFDLANTSTSLQLPGSDVPSPSNAPDASDFNFYIPRDSDVSTFPQFDSDAMLATLDRMFGPAP
ncbi:uncharacterized protein HD556DRAFT_1230959 [Suillus plorans]|uniref:Uncharacterized protein n=1 Tax=Suillus plorans TaxID=116603 RepID=A0A9P7DPM2_9AGAM|nr:uncharacterized protein HD556DRAFT_1230959 [Suillus plorans]KAG1799830.1 hypothetical protein HD556DRAFT_1230959 [Suillus plorans]